MNRALITLQGNYLYLANDGSPFDRLGVISVCIESVSSKETDDNNYYVLDVSLFEDLANINYVYVIDFPNKNLD